MRFNEIPNIISDLVFDGDLEDKRLYLEPAINWWEKEESDYEKVEDKISNFEIKRPKYTVFAWCDVSGFDYWIKQQQDCNYIQITVSFNQEDLDTEEVAQLQKDVNKAYDHFIDNEISEDDYMRLLVN